MRRAKVLNHNQATTTFCFPTRHELPLVHRTPAQKSQPDWYVLLLSTTLPRPRLCGQNHYALLLCVRMSVAYRPCLVGFRVRVFRRFLLQLVLLLLVLLAPGCVHNWWVL